jgi:hypothetical protein
MLNSDAEVETKITTPLTLDAAHDVQTARVKQAWNGVKAALERAATSSAKNVDADFDAILLQPELDDMHTNFWNRYKMSYAADVTGDA